MLMNIENFTVADAEKLGRKIGREISEKIKKCSPILDKRYKECDSQGHQKPAEKENICYYCYRQLEYHTPFTDARHSWERELPLFEQPLNASLVHEESLQEIESQKDADYFNGLAKIAEELNLK